jgi:SAM-dependent methyltransferase
MIKRRIGLAARRVLPGGIYRGFCRLYDRIRAVLLFFSCLGFGRQCPFCKLRFRRFLPDAGEVSDLFSQTRVVGGGSFRDAVCPYCRSFERERHVYLYLKLMTRLFQDRTRLLHIAPERNLRRVLSKRENLQYTTGDLNPAKAQVRVDLTAMDFPDESFDVVICNHVLEHIPDDRAAMAEILRVLRPRGWAMLQVPLAPELATRENSLVVDPRERLRLYGQNDHVRLYGRDYAQRLESIGFRVTATSVRRQFGDSYATRFGLLRDELIYIAAKPAAAMEAAA